MRKIKKSLVALLLLVSVIFSFASCNLIDGVNDFLDRNVDGPGGTYTDQYEIKWIETCDEMLTIIEKMRANGTEIPQIPLFDCEGYGIDVKFRIDIKKSFLNELEEGQEYYDKRMSNNVFSVRCYIFFQDVTIDELESCGQLMIYDCLKVVIHHNITVEDPKDAKDIQILPNPLDASGPELMAYVVSYNGKNQFKLEKNQPDFVIAEEQIEILEKTIMLIE